MRTDEYDFDASGYYEMAEGSAQGEFQTFIAPAIASFDLSSTLDFACGHGRMAPYLAPRAERLVLCDVSADAVAECRRRYGHVSGIEYLVNDLEGIPLEDSSITAVVSWDAMVHFDYSMVDVYARQFARVMAPGASGFLHHSNLGGMAPWMDSAGYRAATNAAGVAWVLEQAGFTVTEQRIIEWGGVPGLDALTTFTLLTPTP